MIEDKYRVIMGGHIIAKDMSLANAVILLKGIFDEYYEEYGLEATIQRQSDESVEPDYSNKINTTQLLDLGSGQKKCACCGMIYEDIPWSPFCIGCKKTFTQEVSE
jgi:hypothetical protein